MRPNRFGLDRVYLADINNDGAQEWGYVAPGDASGAYIDLYVFKSKNNKANKKDEFLLMCGTKLIMEFSLADKLDRYIWEKSDTRPVQ